MANILDELVRVGALHSKNEARSMIKNKGVSLIPCINEDYEIPCFEITVPNNDWENDNIKAEQFFIEPKTGEKQLFFEGYIIDPNGTKIPAKMWDVRDININLLSFREHLVFDNKKDFFSLAIPNPNAHPIAWQNGTMCIITWDKKFGKNPWLLNDINLDCTIKPGDIIKLGKRSIIVE